jgi:2',3'-cyclic-nucleotide 2'-phosphodiesterase (5'-nucleotidase family)
MAVEARGILRLAVALALLGCGSAAEPPAPAGPRPASAADRAPVDVTVLYTSDEHGWISPNQAGDRLRGGALELLARFREDGHCAGALPPDAAAAPDERCGTLLLSGGDNFTGPAISSHFRGATMAAAMRRLGYVASAFGNHELDFGREAFEKNRATSGVVYLAANVRDTEPPGDALARPYLVVTRRGVRIGVVGLATVTTPETADARHFTGVAFDDPEQTLARVVPEVWAAGADAVVVVAHECPEVVLPVVARHPDWSLSFVGLGHCHSPSVTLAAGVPVIGPGWRLEHYARVRLRIDPSRPARARARVLSHELVSVSTPRHEPPRAPVDRAFAERITGWQQELDRELGEVIGYSRQGLAKKAPAIGQWIVRAWKTRFDVDVALTNRGSVRQELPPGPIRLSTLVSIMPFENELVVCRVPGRALEPLLAGEEAIVAGLERQPDGRWAHPDGGALAPDRIYRIVTTDFVFRGGDGFRLREHDPAPTMTGVHWRDPVVAWTREQRTTAERPLESLLAP